MAQNGGHVPRREEKRTMGTARAELSDQGRDCGPARRRLSPDWEEHVRRGKEEKEQGIEMSVEWLRRREQYILASIRGGDASVGAKNLFRWTGKIPGTR